jgi:hypothetical protein
VSVNGLDPQPVHRGAQQVVVTLARPRVLRTVTLRSSVGVSVGMIAALPPVALP